MRQIFRYNQFYHKGFTLVELIVVVTLTSLLAAGAVQLIDRPTRAYFDTIAYANLADRADLAVKRVTREVSNALPNSVRVSANGSGSFLEFVPVESAARYRAAIGLSPSDDALDFSLNSDTFDILGPSIRVQTNDQLVIYNLGITGADAYQGSNRRPIVNVGLVSSLHFSGGAFPLASPSRRFYIVSSATSFVCDTRNQRLVMYQGYPIQSAQPVTIAALNRLAVPSVLALNVESCRINYATGAQQRMAMVTMQMVLKQDHAKMNLFNQVTMVNSP